MPRTAALQRLALLRLIAAPLPCCPAGRGYEAVRVPPLCQKADRRQGGRPPLLHSMPPCPPRCGGRRVLRAGPALPNMGGPALTSHPSIPSPLPACLPAQIPFKLHVVVGPTDADSVCSVILKKAADVGAECIVMARHNKGAAGARCCCCCCVLPPPACSPARQAARCCGAGCTSLQPCHMPHPAPPVCRRPAEGDVGGQRDQGLRAPRQRAGGSGAAPAGQRVSGRGGSTGL